MPDTPLGLQYPAPDWMFGPPADMQRLATGLDTLIGAQVTARARPGWLIATRDSNPIPVNPEAWYAVPLTLQSAQDARLGDDGMPMLSEGLWLSTFAVRIGCPAGTLCATRTPAGWGERRNATASTRTQLLLIQESILAAPPAGLRVNLEARTRSGQQGERNVVWARFSAYRITASPQAARTAAPGSPPAPPRAGEEDT
jgi:hypothetical protein